jgi:MoaA/NifB/PqqE/SkfB family radical SAM enzyme
VFLKDWIGDLQANSVQTTIHAEPIRQLLLAVVPLIPMPPPDRHPSMTSASHGKAVVLFDREAPRSIDRGEIERSAAKSAKAGPRLILWDLLGSCNLRCPSCPVGNMPETKNAKGMITDEFFHRILAKLTREFPKSQLYFYNWTEPLIHPNINAYCKAAADAGFHVHLSSNLNVLKNEHALLAAGVKTIRISLSGFTQQVYGQGHKGGKIDKVKANMRQLSDAKTATGSRTKIHVYYHKYRHNLHEMPLMEAYAKELGFEFIADWAFLMPVEQLIGYVEDTIGDDQRDFAADSIVPDPRDAIAIMQPRGSQPCELIDQLAIDHQGNVTLCCAVYDAKTTTIGNYLDLTWDELQRLKYGHTACDACMHYGAQVLYTHYHQPDLRKAMLDLADAQMELGAKHVRHGESIRLPVLNTRPFAESA